MRNSPTMRPLKTSKLPLQSAQDVVMARQTVRQWTSEMKFSLVDQTKIVTATSELARNTVEHGGGGEMTLEIIENGVRNGIRLIFEDQGPGIADVEQALRDGYTTGGGMGLGLSGSKRLMNEFDIQTALGQGTKVSVTRWK